MEHRNEINNCFSEFVVNLLMKEARDGKLKKSEIRHLALELGGGCYRVFNEKEHYENSEEILVLEINKLIIPRMFGTFSYPRWVSFSPWSETQKYLGPPFITQVRVIMGL